MGVRERTGRIKVKTLGAYTGVLLDLSSTSYIIYWFSSCQQNAIYSAEL